jgi:hypothetical protein
VEYTFNVGCGVFVGVEPDTPEKMITNFIGTNSEDSSDDWKMYRSFFLAIHGNAELDFKPSAFLSDLFM